MHCFCKEKVAFRKEISTIDMRSYNEIEKRTIRLLVEQGYGSSSYIAINAFNDIFYRNNVAFEQDKNGSYSLVFYYSDTALSDSHTMMAIQQELNTMVLLIESLIEQKYITLISNNATNQLTSIDGFDKTGLQGIQMPIDKHIGDMVVLYANNSAFISESLKDLNAQLSDAIELPIKTPNPKLYFEKQRKLGQRSDYLASIATPKQFPAFVLCHNHDWDDNEYHNWYCLHYFDPEGEWHKIGELHIMHKDEESYNHIPDTFNSLSVDFCSLGNDVSYYDGLRNVLGRELAEDVLFALQDSAVNLTVYDRYKEDAQFRLSLNRESIEAEKCLREARFRINGRNMNDAFSFLYAYHPPYNTESETNWHVKLAPDNLPFKKCIGVIGENGVGKTQMLRQFIEDLLSRKADNFRSALPVYSCIIAIFSTPFDPFMRITGGDFTMPYIKCCLEQSLRESEDRLLEGIIEIQNRGSVHGVGLMQHYVNQLRCELPKENINKVFVNKDSGIGILRHYEVDKDELHNLLHRLSSGQLQIFLLLTNIYRFVHYDSLFIIDEPEIHLHPSAIVNFMSLLNELLRIFDSYAIITTHSPLIVREILGQNVFVMRRMEDDDVYIGSCQHDTFGEDVSILYKDIFEYDESRSCFREFVKSTIERNPDYEKVMETIAIEGLSVNSRFSIRNMLVEYLKSNKS